MALISHFLFESCPLKEDSGSSKKKKSLVHTRTSFKELTDADPDDAARDKLIIDVAENFGAISKKVPLIEISAKEKMCLVGKIHTIVEKLVVVESVKHLDTDAVLYLSHGRPLGRVSVVIEHFYLIKLKSSKDIASKGIKIGGDVFVSPEKIHSISYRLVDELHKQKGSDASWKHNNKPAEELLKHFLLKINKSDDEDFEFDDHQLDYPENLLKKKYNRLELEKLANEVVYVDDFVIGEFPEESLMEFEEENTTIVEEFEELLTEIENSQAILKSFDQKFEEFNDFAEMAEITFAELRKILEEQKPKDGQLQECPIEDYFKNLNTYGNIWLFILLALVFILFFIC